MDNKLLKAKTLLRKYRNGTCTAEEKAWVEQWYLQLNTHETDLRDDELREDLQELRIRLGSISNPKSRQFFPLRAAAAILILALVGIGIHKFLMTNEDTPNNMISQYGDDVLPGGNRAILTLPDGSKIDLDRAVSGLVAKQDGSTVTKNQDGLITYELQSDGLDATDAAFHTIATPNGGQYRVILPDGSKVWLNAASKLRYPVRFAKGERRVELSGEAFFEVKASNTGPFRVITSGQEIEVMGTKFNVNAYPDEDQIKTTLIEGKVKASVPHTDYSRFLGPGEQAISGVGTPGMEVRSIPVRRVIAWKNGDFLFKDEAITSVLRKIARWYDAEIIYEGEIPDAQVVAEIARSRNLSEVLRILELTGAMQFRVEGRKIYIQ